MCESMEGQVNILDLGIWCGKTCQDHSVQAKKEKEQISLPSSKKSSKSCKKMPLWMCLKKDGQMQDVSKQKMDHLVSLTEYTMDSFGEAPGLIQRAGYGDSVHRSEEGESLLSQILVDCPHPKYYLSEKACRGILNRANKRGKELPEVLQTALQYQIDHFQEVTERAMKKYEASLCKLGGGVERDSSGKQAGKGALIQVERTGALGTVQDKTLFSLEGNGARPSHQGSGISDTDKMFTLNSTEVHGVAYGCDGYNGDVTCDKSPTIGVNCGISTGRNQVIEKAECYSVDMGGGKTRCMTYEEKSPTLCTTHYGEPAVATNDDMERKS